ncbi:phosphatase PAP2 family protein [Alloscardovia venturai]|uniref:Phosphatase PAP2 family protein n=1 Tax=Alloscardovia venturai TaxID=1769421 RepID=A0ABW2Y2M2_9BIFI
MKNNNSHTLAAQSSQSTDYRTLAARVGIISGFVFILLLAFVWSGATAGMDLAITTRVVHHRIGFLNPIALGFTALGGTIIVILLTIIALGYLAYRRKWLEVEIVFGALAGDVVIVTALKKLVNRQRPSSALWLGHVEDQQSFPSGHSANNTVLWLTVALVLTMIAVNEAERTAAKVMTILGFIMPLCIGWSRIYTAQHWTSDVLSGWSLGLAWVSIVAWVYLNQREKRKKARENATPRIVSSK